MNNHPFYKDKYCTCLMDFSLQNYFFFNVPFIKCPPNLLDCIRLTDCCGHGVQVLWFRLNKLEDLFSRAFVQMCKLNSCLLSLGFFTLHILAFFRAGMLYLHDSGQLS